MGTTLENGVYLPSEGERNCYAGLKTNWEILDQKVADVTALQQAVAGALHREIVESLPTTDIDPNTIYMVLSGTSATENVYNEYMYVNNAWELIGTSATDLTNYYTKSEVDDKLLLKANDSDVVHKSVSETISGYKTFSYNMTLYNSSASVNPVALFFKNKKVVMGSTTDIGSQNIAFRDSADTNLSILKTSCESVGNTSFEISVYNKDSNNQTVSGGMLISQTPANTYITPTTDNSVLFGSTSRRWSKIYGAEYYYGSNNVEFSTKFVTTDTNQTITESKTFSENVSIYNSDASVDAKYLIFKNQKVKRGSTTETGTQFITFQDKDSGTLVSYEASVSGSGNTQACINVSNLDANSQRVVGGVKVIKTPTETWFIPDGNNTVSSGLSNYKWKDVNTYLVNGLTPSSLSMPSNTGYVDISSYFTNTGDGQTNSYIASANGWIYLNVTAKTLVMQIKDSNNKSIYADMRVRSSDGIIYMTIPIGKGNKLLTEWFTSSSVTITTARFIPCQGNV